VAPREWRLVSGEKQPKTNNGAMYLLHVPFIVDDYRERPFPVQIIPSKGISVLSKTVLSANDDCTRITPGRLVSLLCTRT